MSVLSRPYFHDEAAAFKFVEGIIWPESPVCPHCGCTGRVYAIKPNAEKKVRMGLKKCGDCRKQFTVRVGTLFEDSHIPLHKWLQAIYLMCSSKKGVSSKQIERTLEITYRSAWFLTHRIREAMRSGELGPFGLGGATVEVDETFIGREPGAKGKRGVADKMKVLSLIERETGRARSFVLDGYDVQAVVPIVEANLSREARLRTDESQLYVVMGRAYREHETVNHRREEYVRKNDPTVHTQTIEGYFSIFKRGMRGVYQHCGKKHLHRYLAEFDFRYSYRERLGVDDEDRAEIALKGIVGKRLTYRPADSGRTPAEAPLAN
jgi:transposase-like protein